MEKNNYIILVEYLAKKIPNVYALSYFTHPKLWIETYEDLKILYKDHKHKRYGEFLYFLITEFLKLKKIKNKFVNELIDSCDYNNSNYKVPELTICMEIIVNNYIKCQKKIKQE